MKLDLTGLRIEVTDAFRDFTEKKIQNFQSSLNQILYVM